MCLLQNMPFSTLPSTPTYGATVAAKKAVEEEGHVIVLGAITWVALGGR